MLLVVVPDWAFATTWYVRPDTDGINDLNYGTEDGTSYANAFDGFADITGLAAGDTVCLPGGDEPFYGESLDTATSGTQSQPITYENCGTTRSLLWQSSNLTGDRSYNSSRVLVTGNAAYAWVSMGNDIYKKRIDFRPRVLWEDATWLEPMDIDAASEATILATLQPGHWGNRNNGDATFRLYYRATTAAKSPTTTTIRSNLIPAMPFNGTVHIDRPWIVLRGIEIRGNASQAQPDGLQILRGTHVLVDDVYFVRNEVGVEIIPFDTANDGTTLLNCYVLYSGKTGVSVNPFGALLSNLTIQGGSYSYSLGVHYDGTHMVTGDGDGIGIGQAGGVINDLVIRGIRADGNYNYGIFSGTDQAYKTVRFSLIGARMTGNRRGCFSEGDDAEIEELLLVTGLDCSYSLLDDKGVTAPNPTASILFRNVASAQYPAVTRTIRLENSTFRGNVNKDRVFISQSAINTYVIQNILFEANPGNYKSADLGDFNTNGTALTQTTFDRIYFYSLPNQAKLFARLGTGPTSYLYNSGSDLTAFTTDTGATNITINVDPLVRTDGKLAAGSPARGTGTESIYCRDARDLVCNSPPDIGAFQVLAGDIPNLDRTAIARDRTPIGCTRALRGVVDAGCTLGPGTGGYVLTEVGSHIILEESSDFILGE
jgi:hypothetical protein